MGDFRRTKETAADHLREEIVDSSVEYIRAVVVLVNDIGEHFVLEQVSVFGKEAKYNLVEEASEA